MTTQYDTIIQDIIEHQYEMKQTQYEVKEIIVSIMETLAHTDSEHDSIAYKSFLLEHGIC
jgi:hypothetical protein